MTRIYSAGASVKGLIVDGTGAALTRATSNTRQEEATNNSESFNINTGVIGLTVATDTAILYYKHLEDKPLIMDTLIIGIENNGTDSNPTSKITIVRNPTAGDIISGASAAGIVQNRNFSSVSTPSSSLAYKGAAGGSTLTDGDDFVVGYAGYGRTVIPLDVVLNKGNSIGFKLDLQANTGTVNCYAALACHLRQGDQ